MKKDELLKLADKLGFNKVAIENHLKSNPKIAEKQINDAAKFMGLKK